VEELRDGQNATKSAWLRPARRLPCSRQRATGDQLDLVASCSLRAGRQSTC